MLLRAAVIGVAVLVGVIAWVASRGGDDSSPAPAEPESRLVSEAELFETAANSGQPIYWAGPVPGTELELIEVVEGGYQVRYLPEGDSEEASTEFLTVGSYPLPNPAKALEEFAKQPGSISRQSSDGRKVVTSRESPSNVYFVSPDNSVQVEVYDPSPKRAMSLALTGAVKPAG
jgi:hypothetical protein